MILGVAACTGSDDTDRPETEPTSSQVELGPDAEANVELLLTRAATSVGLTFADAELHCLSGSLLNGEHRAQVASMLDGAGEADALARALDPALALCLAPDRRAEVATAFGDEPL